MATRDRPGRRGRGSASEYDLDGRAHRFERPYPASRRYEWREDVRSAPGLDLLAGIWLIISPFVLDYAHADAV
jgi:hypothetical protein